MDQSAPTLRATFMGVTTILFDDGQDSILIDGFFTRPSFWSTLFWWIKPNEKVITQCMKKAGIDDRLKGVFVAHSHFDHVMDAPVVCKLTGAKLVGSTSTKVVGESLGLPDAQCEVVKDGDVLQYGAFRITIFEGIHSPGDVSPGDIESSLTMPTSYKAYRTGKCYSWLIEHGSTKIFVHPSANYVPNKFSNIEASVLFLGVGLVGKQSETWREEYWKETAGKMKPKKIVPVHWDNFFLSLDLPLAAPPWWADKWTVVEEWLKSNCEEEKIELYIQKAWEVLELK